MALTSKEWKTINQNNKIYGSLTEENKKKFWEYGVSNGLVDFQNIKPENIEKLKTRFGVTQDFYSPKYLLKKDSADGKKAQTAAIESDELKFAKRQVGMMPTGETKVTKSYNPTTGAPAEFEQVKAPAFTPIKSYTTVQPTLKPQQLPQQTIRNIQTLKEKDLDPVINTPTRPLSSRLQEDFGQLQYNRPTNALQASAYGVAEGIKGAFGGGLLRTPEEQRIFDESAQFKGVTLPGVQGGGLSPRLAEDFGQSKSTDAVEISARDLGMGVGRFGAEAVKYAALTPVLASTKIGQGLVKLAEKLGIGKFGQAQALDAFADMAIQTPTELIESIDNDDSASDFTKKWLANRALDIAMNYGIGKGLQGLEGALKSKSVVKALDDVGVSADDVKVAVENNDQNLIKQIREKLDIKAQSDGVQVQEGLKDIPLSQRMQQASGISPLNNVGNQIEPIAQTIKPFEVPKVEKPKIEPTLKSVQAQMPKTDDDLIKSFSDKVSPTPIKKKGKTIKEQAFNARKQFEDDLLEFQRLEKSVKGKVDSAEKSIYKTARIYKGAPEKANEFIRTELAPVIDKVVASGKSQDDLSKYALAVHAKDVNNAGLKSGMTNEEINAVIKRFGTPELEQARKELVAVSNKALDDLLDSGRISKESVDAMREKWPNYMPLSRNFDDDKVDFVTGLGKTFSNVSNPIQKLKGSDREIIDPIESMVKNIYKITDAAERNKVGVQLAKLADQADDSIIRKLDADEVIGRKNVVTVYVDGKKTQYEVEPEVFKAFNNLDQESSNTLINMLSKPASLLRAGATLTPEFALRNPFRDIQNAFVVSKSGFNPLLDFPAGLASTLKKDKLYSQWLKEGGGYGNIMSMDRQAHKEALQNALKKPIQDKFVNVITPKGFMAMLRMVSDTTESATKLGEFRAALRSGATAQEAAFRSRDLMDFARSGYSIRPANKVVAFLNANIQGKSKLVRAIADNPKGVMARMATSMVLPTIAVSAFASQFGSEEQKKTIKDAPDWLRNSFWLVPIPGTDMIARFPKPFDISAVANTTERFIDYMAKNDKEAFDGFVKSTLKEQSIPLQLTGLLPLIEAQTNYSFFREGPIIPMGDQYREKKDQYDTRTSHLARALASVAGKFDEDSNFASPKVMDYVIKSSTAGLGQYAIDATDMVVNGLSKDKGPVKPSLRPEQLPVLKAFAVSPFTSGKSVDFVYSTKDKLAKEKSSSKFNNIEFSPQKQELLDYANDQTKALTDISKAIKEIEKSTTLTSTQKRDEIVKLNKERNRIAQESAEYIKKVNAK